MCDVLFSGRVSRDAAEPHLCSTIEVAASWFVVLTVLGTAHPIQLHRYTHNVRTSNIHAYVHTYTVDLFCLCVWLVHTKGSLISRHILHFLGYPFFFSLPYHHLAPFSSHVHTITSTPMYSLPMGRPSCWELEATWCRETWASAAGACWTALLYSAMQKKRYTNTIQTFKINYVSCCFRANTGCGCEAV